MIDQCEQPGAQWVRAMLDARYPVGSPHRTISPFGARVANLLDSLFLGIYHIERAARSVAWSDPRCIEINLGHELATTDFNQLTRLVFLAHHYCIRVAIDGRAPGWIRLQFHPRQRGGGISDRHPTLAEAIAAWEMVAPLVEEEVSTDG